MKNELLLFANNLRRAHWTHPGVRMCANCILSACVVSLMCPGVLVVQHVLSCSVVSSLFCSRPCGSDVQVMMCHPWDICTHLKTQARSLEALGRYLKGRRHSSSLRTLLTRGQTLTFTSARVLVRAPIGGPRGHNPPTLGTTPL